MTTEDALALVFARNAFYKRMHYLALAAFMLSLCVLIFLIVLFIYVRGNPTRPLYFATDAVGRLIPIIPESVPNMPPDQITAWVVENTKKALSYDFINYHSQFQSAEKYFTLFGWTNYMQAIQRANNLPAVIQRKMIVVAQLAGPPKVVREGNLGGAYAWKYEMPMLLVYMLPPYDEKSKYSNPVKVSVIVQRQPILKSDKGLGIVQLLAESTVSYATQPQEISGTPGGT